MGFPETFNIPVSDTQAYRQFGNSVVVPVVERIAHAVVTALKVPVGVQPDLVLRVGESRVRVRGAAPKKKKVRYVIARSKK